MSKRYSHSSVLNAKQLLVISLSYILAMHMKNRRTLASLSREIGCSASLLSRIKNGHETGYTLDTAMTIADAIDLNYRILMTRDDGVTVTHTEVEEPIGYCMRKGLTRRVRYDQRYTQSLHG